MKAAVELLKRAAGLSRAVGDMERVEAIDIRLSAIRDEERGLGGYLPPGEVGEALAAWLRDRRERFERADPPRGEHSGARDLLSAAGAGRSLVGTLRTAAPELAVLDLVLFLLGPDAEDMAREAVSRLAYEPGPGAAERRRKGAALAAERARLVAEREALVDRLSAAGVVVEHLAETVARRAVEAREAERAAEQQRRQAELSARVDRREADGFERRRAS